MKNPSSDLALALTSAPHRRLARPDPQERFLADLLDSLWDRYRTRVPYIATYAALLAQHGARFRNDHVAFRAIAWQEPRAGLFELSRVFVALGYRLAGNYVFPSQHLDAVHLAHPNGQMPKVFLSELRAWELSAAAQRAIARSLSRHRPAIPLARLTRLDRLSGGTGTASRSRLMTEVLEHFDALPWPVPTRRAVATVEKESQYGAWVLLHGYRVNHFTASIDAHGPGALEDIEKTIKALRRAGVPMKPKIEGRRGSRLRQSSTLAVVDRVQVQSGARVVEVPWTYAYFELAERPILVDPATGRRSRFEGFLGGQATHLFEITRRG